ncbi:hypothetical protein MKK58_08725 [Methylobacterium sp. J-078]|uniref:hypothetical protein n=1 Tax=Methylobacterium sp. J-078 TaxID=2836657 RepID=UPI001FBAEB58|nr:hypothetical protein [Methylobacterium sp. J-078]MCJ2044611.1 hypothetical protein [Methylobacterium sp. J-078]
MAHETTNLIQLSVKRKKHGNSEGLDAFHPASYITPDVDGKERPKGRKAKLPRSTVTSYEARVPVEQFRLDLERPAAWLKVRYAGSLAALESRIRVSKAEGTTIDPSWRGRGGFQQFLRDMPEPRRHESLSLDRLNPHGTHYGPGTCRWADKKEQANNRRSNVMATHPATGKPATATEVAEYLGIKPNTLLKRIREGKSLPDGVVVGRQAEPMILPEEESQYGKRWPWPLTREQHAQWENNYAVNRQTMTDERGRDIFEHRWEFALRITRLHASGWRREAQSLSKQLCELYDEDNGPPAVIAEYERALSLGQHWHKRQVAAEAFVAAALPKLRLIPRERPHR